MTDRFGRFSYDRACGRLEVEPRVVLQDRLFERL
jgi:hypothetical protein